MALTCQASRHVRCTRRSGRTAAARSRLVMRATAAAPAKTAAIDLSDLQFINPMWGQPKTEQVGNSSAWD